MVAIVKAWANTRTASERNQSQNQSQNQSLFVVAFSIWAMAILGLYLDQFRHLIGPIMGIFEKAMNIQ